MSTFQLDFEQIWTEIGVLEIQRKCLLFKNLFTSLLRRTALHFRRCRLAVVGIGEALVEVEDVSGVAQVDAHLVPA